MSAASLVMQYKVCPVTTDDGMPEGLGQKKTNILDMRGGVARRGLSKRGWCKRTAWTFDELMRERENCMNFSPLHQWTLRSTSVNQIWLIVGGYF